MMISTKKDAMNYSPKWMGAIYFSIAICGQNQRDQNEVGTSVVPDQPHKISSP
jgi:hypothetical protein